MNIEMTEEAHNEKQQKKENPSYLCELPGHASDSGFFAESGLFVVFFL